MLLDSETRRRGDSEARRNTRRTSFPDWLPCLQGYAGKSKPASAETAEVVRLRSEAHDWGGRLTNAARGGYRSWSGAFQCWQGEGRHGANIRFLRTSRSARRLFRLGRDRVEFERCCLTRRRGGAEKHAENMFSGLVSVLARLRRKVKTCERGDSGDRTASQRGYRWGGRLTNAMGDWPSFRRFRGDIALVRGRRESD